MAKDVKSQPRAITMPPMKAARRGDLWRQKDMINGEKSWQVERQEETIRAKQQFKIKKIIKQNPVHLS